MSRRLDCSNQKFSTKYKMYYTLFQKNEERINTQAIG